MRNSWTLYLYTITLLLDLLVLVVEEHCAVVDQIKHTMFVFVHPIYRKIIGVKDIQIFFFRKFTKTETIQTLKIELYEHAMNSIMFSGIHDHLFCVLQIDYITGKNNIKIRFNLFIFKKNSTQMFYRNTSCSQT